MAIIKDGRGSARTGIVSRERVIERHKDIVRDAVRRAVTNGKIDEIGKDGLDVTIPKRDLSQPNIVQGQGGKRTYVHTGNKDYVRGDQIERPKGGSGGGGGGQASEDGSGEDDFTIHLNEEEVLNVIYEELGLPNLNILSAADTTKTQMKYAGIVSEGTPDKLHMVRSKRSQIGRLIATSEPDNRKILKLRREQKAILSAYDPLAKPGAGKAGLSQSFGDLSTTELIKRAEAGVNRLTKAFSHAVSPEDNQRLNAIEEEVKKRRKKLKQIPQFDEVDLKFRSYAKQPVPCAKAVMFCLMDVSGSMTEERKYKAQMFYFLLYKFLERNYDKIDIVYVRHHTQAQEVDRENFFHSKETGGTQVSAGLRLVSEIQKDRFSTNDWNIYLAQASDGDNWHNDDPICNELMRAFLPKAQAVFYTEITEDQPQSLWRMYEGIKKDFPNKFWMANIRERSDVVKVFREFFRKNTNAEGQARLAAAPAMNGP